MCQRTDTTGFGHFSCQLRGCYPRHRRIADERELGMREKLIELGRGHCEDVGSVFLYNH